MAWTMESSLTNRDTDPAGAKLPRPIGLLSLGAGVVSVLASRRRRARFLA